jgi:hypothetical protein
MEGGQPTAPPAHSSSPPPLRALQGRRLRQVAVDVPGIGTVNVGGDGSVAVDMPFAQVQADEAGATVNAPGTTVDTTDGTTQVTAPAGVGVNATSEGANVTAPGTEVSASG